MRTEYEPGGDVTTALASNTASLAAGDRCDRCGAQAYVRATLTTGGELLFCLHHANEHRGALEARGAVFYDESGRLAETEGTAPVDER
jgi:hypothetical protein